MRLIAMMILVAAGANVAAGKTGGELARGVTVCMDRDNAATLWGAKEASKVFAGIGVAIEWHTVYDCPSASGAIRAVVSDQAPPLGHDSDLAYAFPYEGTRIVIFYGRIKDMARSKNLLLSRLLAYVLAHEIAHVLQWTSQHSEAGIMKAKWSYADEIQIQLNTLRFTASDVDLIHRGLAARLALEAAHERGTTAAN
jgi:hypothetical protein